MKALEDLKGMKEKDVLEHLAKTYSGDKSGHDYGTISDSDIKIAKGKLKNMKVLFVYESVGDYGCDSSSYFLLKHKTTGKLFEIHGSHCSCYGFEGQLDLEPTTIKTLKDKIKNGGKIFYCGGYDTNETENQEIAKEFVLSM